METPSLARLIAEVRELPAAAAAHALRNQPGANIRDVLSALPLDQALDIAARLPGADSAAMAKLAMHGARISGTVSEFVESAAVDLLVHHATPDEVSYVYVVDPEHRLVGVFGMRDLLLAKPSQLIAEIMVAEPLALTPDMRVERAMGQVFQRHLSRYPVVDERGVLIGQVRGRRLVERSMAEIGSQVGTMVGVGRKERIGAPLLEAFRMRHPWLQVNLLTAFVAAFVVSLFEDTIARVVVLAAFLPVLAGQSGNTGCQALAITLRGMTLGEFETFPVSKLLRKEIQLGALNGAVVGVVAGIAMWAYAETRGAAQPGLLAFVIFVAMVASCVGSGIFGVLVPVTLRRFGAAPAMASSIFLTTFTDILGMGLMLGLAAAMLA